VVAAGLSAQGFSVQLSLLGQFSLSLHWSEHLSEHFASVAVFVSEAGALALLALPPHDDIMAAIAKALIMSRFFFIFFVFVIVFNNFGAKLQIISVIMYLYLLVLMLNFAK